MRIAIALPHRCAASSWGWAITRRPVPISLAGRGTSRDEDPIDSPNGERTSGAARTRLICGCSLVERDSNSPFSAIVTQQELPSSRK